MHVGRGGGGECGSVGGGGQTAHPGVGSVHVGREVGSVGVCVGGGGGGANSWIHTPVSAVQDAPRSHKNTTAYTYTPYVPI